MYTYFFFLFMNKKKIISCEHERSFSVAIAPEHGIENPIQRSSNRFTGRLQQTYYKQYKQPVIQDDFPFNFKSM